MWETSPQLRELVDSGSLSELRWPNFPRLQGDVKRFYELNRYQLAWVRPGAPVPQAHTSGSAVRPRRDFSHGCIRVEKPEELAQWVLRGLPGLDMDHIRRLRVGSESRWVNLAKPIPVLIVYGTAVVRKGGKVFSSTTFTSTTQSSDNC